MSLDDKFAKIKDAAPPSRRRAGKALLDLMTQGHKTDVADTSNYYQPPGIRKLKPGQTGPGIVEWTPRDPRTVTPFVEGQLSLEEVKKTQKKYSGAAEHGSGIGGSGGGGSSSQPRVPAGSPNGGQWTKK